MKKLFWSILGFLSLGLAYVGVVTPGIPYSPFVVFAAYCFAKSNKRMHDWIVNHRLFGPFLSGWSTKRVFPLKLKFFMLASMSVSLLIMWATGVKPVGVFSTAVFMMLVAVWAWRYPSSGAEYDLRISQGKKIGWINNSF